jgi:hypothetical protein
MRIGHQNGLDTVSFNGSSRVMEVGEEGRFDAVGQLTVFVVFRSDGFEDQYEALLTKGDNSWRLHRENSTDSIAFHADTNGQGVRLTSATSVNDSAYHLVTARADGGQYALWLDGVLERRQSAGAEINRNNESVNLGSNSQAQGRNWDGKLAEVMIFLSAVSEEDREGIEGYLMTKWGL